MYPRKDTFQLQLLVFLRNMYPLWDETMSISCCKLFTGKNVFIFCLHNNYIFSTTSRVAMTCKPYACPSARSHLTHASTHGARTHVRNGVVIFKFLYCSSDAASEDSCDSCDAQHTLTCEGWMHRFQLRQQCHGRRWAHR